MKLHICPRCGENLEKTDDGFRCKYCGAQLSEQSEDRISYALQSILDEAKQERFANAKRLLWDAAHEKYPSAEKVCDTAKAVLLLNDSDFLAGVYLHSHARDPHRLCAFLASSSVTSAEAEEAYRWLLPSLSLRLVGPLRDFVDRHFSNEARISKVNELESEAERVAEGIYEPAAPREVFLCYSSKDMPKVIETMEMLESNGLSCFAAFRNLRHGKGAAENYLDGIKTAMRSCDTIVFISSTASRSMDCDAMKVELPFLISDLSNKPRVEFLIEDYDGLEPYIVKKTLKKAFAEQEWCTDFEDLVDRLYNAIEGGKEIKKEQKDASPLSNKPAAVDAESLRLQIEQEYRAKLEMEETKKRIEEEVKRKLEEEHKAKEEEDKTKPRIEGRFVYFGEYPQSAVDSSFSFLNLKSPNSQGYVEYEGKRYYKSAGKWYLVEPIKWLILKHDGDNLLLLSEALLDAHRFDAKTNLYDSSEIREWLNDCFLRIAFPDRSVIIAGSNGDKVTLPSKADLENGFADDCDRIARTTTFAKANGAYSLSNDNGCYWTRSSYRNYFFAWRVDADGSLLYDNIYRGDLGVRPCISIKIP